jgi:hypothetical protein
VRTRVLIVVLSTFIAYYKRVLSGKAEGRRQKAFMELISALCYDLLGVRV